MVAWSHQTLEGLDPVPGQALRSCRSLPPPQVSRAAKRLLGNGYCGRPRELDCQYETVCESCSMFFTTIEHRDTIQAQRDDAATQGHQQRQEVYDALLHRLNDDTA